jgi:hypothetical protein
VIAPRPRPCCGITENFPVLCSACHITRSRRGIPKRRGVPSAHIENRRVMPQQTKKAVVDNRGLRNPRHVEGHEPPNAARRFRASKKYQRRATGTGWRANYPLLFENPHPRSNGRLPQSSLNPTDEPRTKHGGGSTCRSVAAPATQTAVTSRDGCQISHMRPSKPIQNDSGLPQSTNQARRGSRKRPDPPPRAGGLSQRAAPMGSSPKHVMTVWLQPLRTSP